MNAADVLIVGAGPAGLCCARILRQNGLTFQIVEAGRAVGGRLRTDTVEGYRLDRGFHLFLTGYPEARAQLDYDKLNLYKFERSPTVWTGQRFRVTRGVAAGGFRDNWRLSSMRRELVRAGLDSVFLRENLTAVASLERRHFSAPAISGFFRPYLGGLLLDPGLGISSRLFEFTFKMLESGSATVPAGGIQAIADQLAGGLPRGAFRFGARVESVTRNHVRLVSGELLTADAVVVAADGVQAAGMLPGLGRVAGRSATCLYYAAPEPPHHRPAVVVNGSGRGIISHLAVMSEVAPGYAPEGKALISVTVPGIPARDDRTLDNTVRGQLEHWYGKRVMNWQMLRAYRIAHAVPVVPAPVAAMGALRLAPGLYACGDYCTTPTLNGAMESGRRAAEQLLKDAGVLRAAGAEAALT